jgi:putative transposase
VIKVEQGSEFIWKAMDEWAYRNGVKLEFSRPDKPTDNAFIESFNGRAAARMLTAKLVHLARRCQRDR